MMAANELAYNDMIRSARIRVQSAELELIKAQEWLRGLENEALLLAKQKVSEGSSDSRTLLKG